MFSPSSPNLDKVVEKILENVQRERIKHPENQETDPTEGVKEEADEMEVKAGEARVSLLIRWQRF